MKKLSKGHKEYITKMIENGDKLDWIQSYCLGAGIDTTKYSSPVHISNEGKISLTYRRETFYYYY